MHSGNGKFPKSEGKTNERINGYLIERETIIEKKEEELFYISFKETWKRDKIEGSWHVTYRVDRVKSDVIEGEPYARPHYNNEEAEYPIESVE